MTPSKTHKTNLGFLVTGCLALLSLILINWHLILGLLGFAIFAWAFSWFYVQQYPLDITSPMRHFAHAILGPASHKVRVGWSLWTIVGIAALCALLPESGIPKVAATQEQVEVKIMKQVQQLFSANKQELFKLIHPIGTAKSVVVHDVGIHWKQGRPTNNEKDVEDFTVRFTIYWEGPIVKDGYTKATQTFDEEVGRWTGGSILSTNGTTTADVFYLGGYLGGEILGRMLEDR